MLPANQTQAPPAEEMAALFEIGLAITSGLTMNAVLQSILDACRGVLPVDTLYIALYDGASETYDVPLFFDQGVYHSLPTINIHERPSITGAIIKLARSIYVPDLQDPETERAYQAIKVAKAPTRSYIGTPLLMRGEVIGVISIQKVEPNAYTQGHVRLLETIAMQAAVAVENAHLYEAAQRELAERKQVEASSALWSMRS